MYTYLYDDVHVVYDNFKFLLNTTFKKIVRKPSITVTRITCCVINIRIRSACYTFFYSGTVFM